MRIGDCWNGLITCNKIDTDEAKHITGTCIMTELYIRYLPVDGTTPGEFLIGIDFVMLRPKMNICKRNIVVESIQSLIYMSKQFYEVLHFI